MVAEQSPGSQALSWVAWYVKLYSAQPHLTEPLHITYTGTLIKGGWLAMALPHTAGFIETH